jgi:alpha-tubulin suppressor-like RCC1 family protein
MENSLTLFGEFPGFDESANPTTGTPLHWESESSTSVLDLAASSHTISLVLSDFTALTLGLNTEGELGIGSRSPAADFTPVASIVPFRATACGSDFTFWLSTDKSIYVAGKTFSDLPQKFQRYRATSLRAYADTFVIVDTQNTVRLWPNLMKNLARPISVPSPSPPEEISCGSHFATLRCGGSVFRIDEDGSLSPVLSVNKGGDGIPTAVSVRSCANYSLVLDDQGNVWLTGAIGSLTRKIAHTPIAQEMWSVFAMPGHCAFVSGLGVTYAFGENACGQLADGTRCRRTRAVEVSVGGPTVSVVGGETFSVYLGSKFDTRLFAVNMDELLPGQMTCPFEKPEDLIDANTAP